MRKAKCFSTITLRAFVGVFLGFFASGWASLGHAAMLIQGIQNGTAPVSNYDRFDNSPAWIGNPSNWSGGAPSMAYSNPWMGVGRDASTTRWATLISPSFIVSASHYAPNIGDTIQFYYTNSLGGAIETRTVIGAESLKGSVSGNQSDVWVGKLSAPITDMPSYPILKLPGGTADPYGGLGISTFGVGALDNGATAVNSTRLGRNTIWAGSAKDYASNSAGSVYAYYFTYDNPGVGPDESQVIAGDSGAPSFFLYAGGTPALTGLHWFNNDPINTVSADTWLSNYAADIQTGMNQIGNAAGEKVKTISPLLGDFNLDGKQTSADVAAMSAALGNLSGYESSHGMNDYYLKLIGDYNGDGVVNGTDLNILSNIFSGSRSLVPGDVNNDGIVDINDLRVLRNEIGAVGLNLPGDVNGDGRVDLSDLTIVRANFGRSGASFSAVPEPTAGVLFVLGSMSFGLFLRGKRSRAASI